jgi:hypothetical protein
MCKPLKARWQQGDQMSLLKNHPKCTPTLFCQNRYLHYFYRGKIVATKFGLCTAAIFGKMPKVNNHPKGEKALNLVTLDGSLF